MKILLSVFYDPKDLGCRYLAAWLRNQGHEVRILAIKTQNDLLPVPRATTREKVEKCALVRDGEIAEYIQNPITEKEIGLIAEETGKFSPELIGFGTRSKNFVHLPKLIPAFRQGAPAAFIVAGGAGPTIEPGVPLELGADAVIRGEGEFPMDDLIESLTKGADWHCIDNVSYLDSQGKVISNKLRQPVRDLDKFPFPALELADDIVIENDTVKRIFDPEDLDLNSISSNFRYFILGSRGCMGDCTYCGGRYLHGIYKRDGINLPRVRQRSLKNVLEELKLAKAKMPLRVVQFWDEFFVWPTQELTEFFREYKKHIDLPYWAYLSPDQLANSPEFLEAAIQAGIATFSVGLQTADEAFCRNVYGRINHNEAIIKVSKEMLANDVPVQYLMILGNALQNADSLRANWNFLKQIEFDPSFVKRVWLTFTKLYSPPYPTKLFTMHSALKPDSVSSAQFYYDALLCSFRQVLADQEFDDLITDKFYMEHPWKLGSHLNDTYESRHLNYIVANTHNLVNRDIYFWGCGTAYQKRKHLFSQAKPVCIFNDLPGHMPDKIDNINIRRPDETPIEPDLPLVIFAKSEFLHGIYKKAKYKYGFKNIITAAYIS